MTIPASRAAVWALLVAFAWPAWSTDEVRSGVAEEARVVARLERDPVTVVSERDAGGGVTGARRFTLRFADGEEIDVKWKRVPGGMDGWNNSPRKEIAAYQVQRLFLDPSDHVIPTTVLRCVPLEVFLDPPPPHPADGHCVLGVLEVWVHDAQIPDEIYDAQRFEKSPSYRRHMADLNLVTYLIDHHDGRDANFLLSNDAEDRRVWSIDNGISFGAPVPNFLVRNWNTIRVPALRREPLERLRALPDDAFDALAVVAEMERGEDGVYRHVAPGRSRDADAGATLGGGRLQLGLSGDEIDAMEDRLEDLLERVEDGKLQTF